MRAETAGRARGQRYGAYVKRLRKRQGSATKGNGSAAEKERKRGVTARNTGEEEERK